MTQIKPTAEQQDIIDVFEGGSDLVIEAGAGVGKSTQLKMIAKNTKRSGLVLYFNKQPAVEAKAAFKGTAARASTAHSLAFQAMKNEPQMQRLGGPRVTAKSIAEDWLGLTRWVKMNGRRPISTWKIASLGVQTVTKFCHSDDEKISGKHVPFIEGADMSVVRREVLPVAREIWEDLQKPDGFAEFSHDHYMKLWALGDPKIDADWAAVDEAQDTNACLAGVIRKQNHLQRVFVGDSCQPPGTMVTVVEHSYRTAKTTETKQVPIEFVEPGDVVVSYSMKQAFLRRTGSRVLGRSANPFAGNLVVAEMSDGKRSRYTPDHRCVVRISPAFRDKHVVYLMRRDDHYRIGLTTGLMASQHSPVGFMLRAATEEADAVWVLGVYETRREAIFAEQRMSWKYGIPQLTFTAFGGSMTQEQIDDLWDEVGHNRDRATEVLERCGRNIDFPIWEEGGDRMLARRSCVVRACNLVDGMEMLPIDGAMDAGGKRVARNQWLPIKLSSEYYEGDVYSFDVENDKTYVADGIVTHNCQRLYAWRGTIDIMKEFSEAEVRYLTQSFRFGDAVAEEANRWLDYLDAPIRLRGLSSINSRLEYLEHPDAILCRTNADVIEQAMSGQQRGMDVAVVGGTQAIYDFAGAVDELRAQGKTRHPELSVFKSWPDVQAYVRDEKPGGSFGTSVRLIERYGTAAIQAVARNCVDARNADFVISTVHKVKGLEWPRVLLDSNLVPDQARDQKELTKDELQVAYVASTRAKDVLDATALQPFHARRKRDARNESVDHRPIRSAA